MNLFFPAIILAFFVCALLAQDASASSIAPRYYFSLLFLMFISLSTCGYSFLACQRKLDVYFVQEHLTFPGTTTTTTTTTTATTTKTTTPSSPPNVSAEFVATPAQLKDLEAYLEQLQAEQHSVSGAMEQSDARSKRLKDDLTAFQTRSPSDSGRSSSSQQHENLIQKELEAEANSRGQLEARQARLTSEIGAKQEERRGIIAAQERQDPAGVIDVLRKENGEMRRERDQQQLAFKRADDKHVETHHRYLQSKDKEQRTSNELAHTKKVLQDTRAHYGEKLRVSERARERDRKELQALGGKYRGSQLLVEQLKAEKEEFSKGSRELEDELKVTYEAMARNRGGSTADRLPIRRNLAS